MIPLTQADRNEIAAITSFYQQQDSEPKDFRDTFRKLRSGERIHLANMCSEIAAICVDVQDEVDKRILADALGDGEVHGSDGEVTR